MLEEPVQGCLYCRLSPALCHCWAQISHLMQAEADPAITPHIHCGVSELQSTPLPPENRPIIRPFSRSLCNLPTELTGEPGRENRAAFRIRTWEGNSPYTQAGTGKGWVETKGACM
ncbi:hypothetical protein lerEdw1_002446 [Lerista edwardsae]|nr:hypothetical protein lerEdw1_002446 [Lerista edwardsae]